MEDKKDFSWDGKSRVVTDLYRKNFNEIFNKEEEEDKDEEDNEESDNKS